jgi:effector-binding domain-containing protein
MRILKTILIILGAIIAIVLAIALMAPKEYHYERSVVIEASAAEVYPHISTLAAMDKWSPWNSYDPDMKKSIDGKDGTVGARSTWEGNDDVGKGEQTLTALKPDEGVELDLKFIEPWQSESRVAVDLVPEGEGTKATWSMNGENDLMGRIMSVFMDMDAMVGKDFDRGLAMLKADVETEVAAERAAMADRTVDGFVIHEQEWPETVYVGKRNKKVKWAEIGSFYEKNFQAAGVACGAAQVVPSGAPSGIYWEWNEKDMTADMMAGFPVKGDASVKVPGMETYLVPAGKVLKIAYMGEYEKTGTAHEALNKYIGSKGLTHYGNVIEEYITDPMSEPDTAKWLTNIYYLVK